MINLFLITNQPDVALYAAGHGVTHIFVDLEIHGKVERQGHRDTLISKHTISDVKNIRKALDKAIADGKQKTDLLVRINPWHELSCKEIDAVVAQGADWIMLPMYRSVEEVELFCSHVAGRARCIPLIETAGACECLARVASLPNVDMLFIGLNDLHIELKRHFMFELLADGTVEGMTQIIRAAGKPFGFGGIARIGEGAVPAEQILGEHLRLGSSAVILSRTFNRPSQSSDGLHDENNFGREVEKLWAVEIAIRSWGVQEFSDNKRSLYQSIQKVAEKMREQHEKSL